jgi:hypothetical protein
MRTKKSSWVLWAVALVSIGLFAGGARANFYDEQYEMTASPDTLAGTVNGHILSVAGGTGTYGPSGSTFSGGIMTFLDDGASSGNQGYFLPPSDTLLIGSANYLCDFRIRVLQQNLPYPGGSKIMSFKSGNGRGLHMDKDGVQFVNGSGGVGTATGFDFNSSFVECRVIINGTLNTADLYVNTTGFVNTPASVGNYVNLASTSMGGSGFAGELGGIGFALGSLSGSGTTQANFDLDWFRVESGTSDVNSIWETAPVPEPSALALLVLGGVAMVMRRRR